MHLFFAGKCIHIISFIKKPLRDETACWHAALRVLRAEAPKYMYVYIYSVFIPESSNGLKFGFQKPDCLGLKLDTQAEGPGMYLIDASEKGGMVEALLLVRGCALQGGPLLVKTRVITCYNPL